MTLPASLSLKFLPDESTDSALAFLQAALTCCQKLGIPAQRLMSDNGGCHRSAHFAATTLGLKHKFTRPYTPRTTGKAERFIQTSLREWACARVYQNALQRASFRHEFWESWNVCSDFGSSGRGAHLGG